jgi:hypothetical protein
MSLNILNCIAHDLAVKEATQTQLNNGCCISHNAAEAICGEQLFSITQNGKYRICWLGRDWNSVRIRLALLQDTKTALNGSQALRVWLLATTPLRPV